MIKAKSVINNKIRSSLDSPFRLHHKFEQKSNLLLLILSFLLVTVVLAEIRGFELVIG